MNLAKNALYDTIIQTTAVGSTVMTGEKVIDMSGYEGVCFVGIMDSVTAAGRIQLQATHSNSTSTTDMVTITNASVGSTASTTGWETKLLVCDVYKPLKRYMSARLNKSAQNSNVNVIAVRYGNRKGAVSQSTEAYGVVEAKTFVSPTT